MSAAKLKKFDSLQLFRGLAALGVVFHHTAISTNAFVGEIPTSLNMIFQHGFLGVDFFFVLSGFIIMSNHFNDDKSIAALKNYCIKRFVRIFPPYSPVSIALMLSYFFLPGMSEGARGEFSWLSSLLLLPDTAPPALSVAWTLIHEFIFYMIFCLFFISGRTFLFFITIWVIAIGLSTWLNIGEGQSPIFARLLSPINLEFMLGMVVACLARKISNRLALASLCMGVVTIIFLLVWPFAKEYRVLFGVPFSLLLLGAVLLEHQRKLLFSRWMVLLGDASYSIYLIHNPLVSITSRLVGKLHNFASWGLGMLVGVAAGVVIGVLYHLFIERPLIGLFRTQIERFRSKNDYSRL